MSGGFVKYKVIMNGHSVEVYEYKIPRLIDSESGSAPDERKMKTPKARESDWKQEIITEDGEIVQETIRAKASLREKYERGFIDKDKFEELKYESLKRSRTRSLNTFRRLFDKNFNAWNEKPKFITIDYHANMGDRHTALKEFRDFIKRFNYYLLKDKPTAKERKKQFLKYLAVIEYQKRGAAHFHIAFFNLKYLHFSKIKELWPHGGVDVKAIKKMGDGNPYRGMVFYMMKYMSKTLIEDIEKSKEAGRLVADDSIEKFFFASKNLLRPEKMLLKSTEEHLLDDLIDGMSVEYETTFDTEYTGEVTLKQYYKK